MQTTWPWWTYSSRTTQHLAWLKALCLEGLGQEIKVTRPLVSIYSRTQESSEQFFHTFLRNTLPLRGGFPRGSEVKNPLTRQEVKETQFDPWVWKIPWRRKWQPTLVFLPVIAPKAIENQEVNMGAAPFIIILFRHTVSSLQRSDTGK